MSSEQENMSSEQEKTLINLVIFHYANKSIVMVKTTKGHKECICPQIDGVYIKSDCTCGWEYVKHVNLDYDTALELFPEKLKDAQVVILDDVKYVAC